MDNDAGMVIFLEQDRFLRRLLLSEENILSWRIHVFVAPVGLIGKSAQWSKRFLFSLPNQ